MKNIKKISALILALILVLSLTATALAVSHDQDFSDGIYGEFNTTDKDDSILTTSVPVINIEKELTAYNPDATNVHAPVITYTYAITAGSADKSITDNNEYHNSGTSSHALTKAGLIPGLKVTGATNGTANGSATTAAASDTSVSDTIVWNNDGTLTTTADGVANKSNLKLDFSGVAFDAAGVYRYVITETASEYEVNGVVDGNADSDTTNIRYLDVYVKDGATAGTYDIYGYVCFKNNNDIDYTASSGTTTVAAAEKTSGFVDTDSATDASNADKYYTFNVEIKKDLVGDQAKAAHQFPFKVTFANSTLTRNFLLIAESTGTAGRATVPTPVSGALSSTVYDGSATTGTLLIKIADDGAVKLTGIPAGTTVTIDELNDVTGTRYKVKTQYGTTNTDPAVAVDWDNWAGTQTATAGTAATALGGTANTNAKVTADFTDANSADKTIIFTNTLEYISPTGVALRVAPYVLMLVAGCMFIVLMRRRREEAEEA